MDITQAVTTASLKDLSERQNFKFALTVYTIAQSREKISRGEEPNLKDIFEDFQNAFEIPASERLSYRTLHSYYNVTLQRIQG